jgi:hypothetical protein
MLRNISIATQITRGVFLLPQVVISLTSPDVSQRQVYALYLSCQNLNAAQYSYCYPKNTQCILNTASCYFFDFPWFESSSFFRFVLELFEFSMIIGVTSKAWKKY